jgi:hypothetical protein
MAKKNKPDKKYKGNHELESVEPRLLFSAGLEGVLAAEQLEKPPDDYNQSVVEQTIDRGSAETTEASAADVRTELIFVDTDTPEYQKLLSDLLTYPVDNTSYQVFELDNTRDGIDQISAVLSGFDNISAIHILSHGSDGAIDLGGATLDNETLAANAELVRSWGSAFTENADILIYGCNLAATEAGETLVKNLASLTGADVAASDDLTGNAQLGGDWELEYQAGNIETELAVSDGLQQSYEAVLANSAPVLTMPGPAINYTENDPATIIDATATVIDSDSADFSGGTLTVSFSAGGTANDELTIVEGGLVTIKSKGDVSVDGKNVASFSGGTNGAPLVINWSTSDDPSTAPRTIDFVTTDGDGGTSNIVQQTVNVTSVNDAPLVAGNDDLNLLQGATGTIPNTLLQVTDADNTAAEVTFTLTAVPANGTLKLNGTALGVNDTFTQADINSGLLTYEHGGADANPDSFTFTAADGVGGTLGATTFDIVIQLDGPGNDAPVLDSLDPALSYTENDPATALLPTATLVDVDSADFGGGTLTVSFSAGGTANDQLTIVDGDLVTVVNGSIRYNNNQVGTLGRSEHGAAYHRFRHHRRRRRHQQYCPADGQRHLGQRRSPGGSQLRPEPGPGRNGADTQLAAARHRRR